MLAVMVTVKLFSYASYWCSIFFKDSGIYSIAETEEINILPLIGKKRVQQFHIATQRSVFIELSFMTS